MNIWTHIKMIGLAILFVFTLFIILHLSLLSRKEIKHLPVNGSIACWYDINKHLVGHCSKVLDNGCICEHN